MAVVDLDAARAAREEAETESHAVKFMGEEFTIPAQAPWGYLEACMGGRAENEVAFLAVRSILGDHYDRFIGLRPTIRDATELVAQVAALWGVDEGEAEASGGSSSPTSSRSRRTSKGSTRSTSRKPSGGSHNSEPAS